MTIYHWTPGEKTHRHGNIQIQIHTFFNFSQTDRGKEDVTKQKFNKLVDNLNFYVQERMINCTFCLITQNYTYSVNSQDKIKFVNIDQP